MYDLLSFFCGCDDGRMGTLEHCWFPRSTSRALALSTTDDTRDASVTIRLVAIGDERLLTRAPSERTRLTRAPSEQTCLTRLAHPRRSPQPTTTTSPPSDDDGGALGRRSCVLARHRAGLLLFSVRDRRRRAARAVMEGDASRCGREGPGLARTAAAQRRAAAAVEDGRRRRRRRAGEPTQTTAAHRIRRRHWSAGSESPRCANHSVDFQWGGRDL